MAESRTKAEDRAGFSMTSIPITVLIAVGLLFAAAGAATTVGVQRDSLSMVGSGGILAIVAVGLMVVERLDQIVAAIRNR